MNKTNIYGDSKICIKCKNHADVVEKGKDYCAACWFKHCTNKTIEEVADEINQEERFVKKK